MKILTFKNNEEKIIEILEKQDLKYDTIIVFSVEEIEKRLLILDYNLRQIIEEIYLHVNNFPICFKLKNKNYHYSYSSI